MNTKKDDVIDVEVDDRSEVLKGKVPKRLPWLFGGVALLALSVVIIFVIQNDNQQRKSPPPTSKAEEAKKGATLTPKTVENVANSQTAEALNEIKGGTVSGKLREGFSDEIARLRGDGTKGTSGVGSDVQTNSNEQLRQPSAEEVKQLHAQLQEAQQKREKIRTSSIFKGGAAVRGVTATDESRRNDYEIDVLKKLNAVEVEGQKRIAALSSQGLPGGVAPATGSGALETEFNEVNEAKALPSPTGVIARSPSKCLLTPGWLIPVANVQRMNSDVPGDVLLVVRENVYDSLTHQCLAIPAGSKILATYNPNVRVGQERFNVAGSVLHLPNGKKVPLAGTRAYEPDGSAGLEADVDNHFFKLVSTSIFLGVVGRISGGDTVSSSTANGSTTATSTVLGKALGDTATTILERNKSIAPTLKRKLATRFNLQVSREWFMEPYRD